MEKQMSNYYTVTSDYMPLEGGNTHAIVIAKASSETVALEYFQSIYGFQAAMSAKPREGIHIDNGFNELLTDEARKIIVKIKSKSPTAPTDFSYSNKIHVNYKE